MPDIVSAVIINWNRNKELEACIESIKNQTYKLIEIVVVDNNSTPPPINATIRLPYNMGVTIPTNIGVASSMGQYILLVDNDATLDKEFVENALYIMKNNVNIVVVAARIYKEGTTEDWDFESYGIDSSPAHTHYMGTFCGTACLIRGDVWSLLEGYNKDYFAYYQEPDLAARMIKWGFKILYSPTCIAWHKFSPESRDNKMMLYYLIRNHFLFVWEHLPLRLALLQSVKWIGWSILRGWKHPRTVVRAYLSVLGCIIYPLMRREALHDPVFTQHWKKVLRRI